MRLTAPFSIPIVIAASAVPALAADDAKQLVEQLRQEREGAQRDVLAKKIRELGDKATESLIGAWRGARRENAPRLVYLLGELKGDEVREDLLKALRSTNVRVKVAAANALSSFPHKSTRGALLRGVEDREDEVAVACLEALSIMGDRETFEPLLRLTRRVVVDNPNPSQTRTVKFQKALAGILNANPRRRDLVQKLCRESSTLDGQAQGTLLALFEFTSESSVARQVARAALVEFTTPPDEVDLGPLDRAIGSSGVADSMREIAPRFAAAAAICLGRARDTKAAVAMIQATSAPQTEVRLAALQSLHLVIPKWRQGLGEEAPRNFPRQRRDAIWAVMVRLNDRDKQVRDRAHAWLKRETKQNLARSFPAWEKWFKSYFAAYDEEGGY